MMTEFVSQNILAGPVFQVKDRRKANRYRRAKVGDLDNLLIPLIKQVE